MERFSGIVSPGFSKPRRNFLQQMFFGIHAAQDVKLSKIGRALREGLSLKNTPSSPFSVGNPNPIMVIRYAVLRKPRATRLLGRCPSFKACHTAPDTYPAFRAFSPNILSP